MLVLRSDLAGDPTFRELLARVRKNAFGAFEHQDVPFEKLVEALHPARDLSRSPLFQVMFAFQNMPRQSREFYGLAVNALEVKNETAKYDLSLYMWDEPGGLAARLEYNTDLFDHAAMKRFLGHFETLLEAVARNPEQRLSGLPLVTDGEREQLLVRWNATDREPPPDRLIHRLLEAQGARTPDRTAVVCENLQLSYRDIERSSNRLANYLRRLGVGPEVAVGICIERSWETAVAVLAVLKAGGFYVPTDPSHPRDRLAFILGDAGVSVLLTHERIANGLPELQGRVVRLDTEKDFIEREDDIGPADTGYPDNLAYVIYTSGSTGRPKGVQVSHRAVANFLDSMRTRPGLTEADVLVAVTTLSFDIAGLELYLPLFTGARVVIAPSDVAADGMRLRALLEKSRATMMQATPATWRMLLEAGWRPEKGFKVLCGGEAMPKELADRLLDSASSVWNLYGPTETTIWSSVHAVAPGPGQVPVGRPIDNTQIYILDRWLSPVPIGVAGELYIGGAGLARGYLRHPELTAEKFVANPFGSTPGARLYRTGDLARYRANGEIEYLGRIDYQVKIRGFRIEPGEVESVLARHPGVRKAAVADRDYAGDKRLVGYLVAAGEAPSAAELKEFLRREVPEYMVPSNFVFLDEMPLTPNGKLDRKALPRPEEGFGDGRSEEDYVAPRTEMEQAIAEAWQEVLGVERVSAHDNFFDLGGHSLLSLKAIARIEEKSGRRIQPRDLVMQTLRQIASVYAGAATAAPRRTSTGLMRRWLGAIAGLRKR
jgi:amino acid adenylation domain-containing protein